MEPLAYAMIGAAIVWVLAVMPLLPRANLAGSVTRLMFIVAAVACACGLAVMFMFVDEALVGFLLVAAGVLLGAGALCSQPLPVASPHGRGLQGAGAGKPLRSPWVPMAWEYEDLDEDGEGLDEERIVEAFLADLEAWQDSQDH